MRGLTGTFCTSWSEKRATHDTTQPVYQCIPGALRAVLGEGTLCSPQATQETHEGVSMMVEGPSLTPPPLPLQTPGQRDTTHQCDCGLGNGIHSRQYLGVMVYAELDEHIHSRHIVMKLARVSIGRRSSQGRSKHQCQVGRRHFVLCTV